MRAVAINVGANTSLPGLRGPIDPDGSFEYVPIPEREPVAAPVPTYGDLDLSVDLPAELRDRRVHLDPTFREYHDCPAYTYGDEHGVKAAPLSELSAGDHVLFYATLSPRGSGHPEWVPPEWGAFCIGRFELGVDPLSGPEIERDHPEVADRYAPNAHVKRETLDAAVLLWGDPDGSRLLDRAVPLSSPDAGSDPNRLVTELSADSGEGPWWRRPLRYEGAAAEALLEAVAAHDAGTATVP